MSAINITSPIYSVQESESPPRVETPVISPSTFFSVRSCTKQNATESQPNSAVSTPLMNSIFRTPLISPPGITPSPQDTHHTSTSILSSGRQIVCIPKRPSPATFPSLKLPELHPPVQIQVYHSGGTPVIGLKTEGVIGSGGFKSAKLVRKANIKDLKLGGVSPSPETINISPTKIETGSPKVLIVHKRHAQQSFEEYLDDVQREITALKIAQGREGFIQLIHSHRVGGEREGEEAHLCYLTSFCGPNLNQIAKKNLSLPLQKTILKRTATILHQAHEDGIAHGDIKPGNICVRFDSNDEDPKVSLIDLGCMMKEDDKILSKRKEDLGTFIFSPPKKNSNESLKDLDVFAFGMTMLCFFTGTPICETRAWACYDQEKIDRDIEEKIEILSINDIEKGLLKTLLKGMLQIDSKKRMSMREVIQSQYFT